MLDSRTEVFLSKMVEEEKFSGVALVKRGDEIVHARAYGMANDTLPNTLDMAFHVASITKQFTAAATMQLVEEGAIDLNENINLYLPKHYRSSHWGAVNVRHLLSHSSGIPDYALERDYYNVVDGWPDAATMDGMVQEAMSKPVEFEPGSDYEYSNIGYTLLGIMIENISGLAYADYVESKILRPAGMTKSRIHQLDHVPSPDEPRGNRWNDTEQRHTKDLVVTLPVTPPDGGLITTLNDFTRWIEVYRSPAPAWIAASSIDLMTRPAIPAGSYDWPEEGIRGEASYGFGLALSGDLLMHEGGIVGFTSYFIHSRNDDLLFVVFANNMTSAPRRIAEGMFELHEAGGY